MFQRRYSLFKVAAVHRVLHQGQFQRSSSSSYRNNKDMLKHSSDWGSLWVLCHQGMAASEAAVSAAHIK